MKCHLITIFQDGNGKAPLPNPILSIGIRLSLTDERRQPLYNALMKEFEDRKPEASFGDGVFWIEITFRNEEMDNYSLMGRVKKLIREITGEKYPYFTYDDF